MRVRYHLARTDVDLDALDSAQRSRLGELASTTDPDVASGLRRVDPSTRRELLEIDDPDVRQSFVRSYGSGSVDDDVVDDALENYRGLDGDDQSFARESIQRSGSDGIRLLGTEICNSPCDTVTTRVNNLPEVVDGLSDADTTKLLKVFEELEGSRALDRESRVKLVEAFETADDVTEGPGADPSRVVETAEYLAARNVDGFVDIPGNPNAFYRGMAGANRIARSEIESGTDPKNVEMEYQIDEDDLDNVPDDSSFDNPPGSDLNDKTDIDVNVVTDVAHESKNTRQYQPLYDSPDEYANLGARLETLRQKLNTFAASGEDQIVVTVREGQLEPYSEEVRTEFPENLEHVRSLDGSENSLASEVESNFENVDVKFETFEDTS